MLSIRDHLNQDNIRFCRKAQDLQYEKELLIKEKEGLVFRVEEISTSTTSLASDLSVLKVCASMNVMSS